MKKVSDVLNNYVRALGINDDKNYYGFFSSWKELIGADLAAHSKVIDIKGPCLIVGVNHPGWITRIKFSEKKLLKTIQKHFPQLGITTLAYLLTEDSENENRIDSLEKPEGFQKDENSDQETSFSGQTEEDTEVELKFSPENLDAEKDKEFLTALDSLRRAMKRRSEEKKDD